MSISYGALAAIMAFTIGLSCSGASAIETNADYLIVHSAKADAKERLAASELARYIAAMTGKEASVVDSDVSIGLRGSRATFLLGNERTNSEISRLRREAGAQFVDLSTLDDEGFEIKSIKKDGDHFVVIRGATPLAILHGVYDYLERFCKVGFFMDGDYVPSLNAVPVSELSYTTKPRFRYRHFNSCVSIGFKKYYMNYRSPDEVERQVSWYAKRKLNLTNWPMHPYATYAGLAAVRTFGLECKPQEHYHGGWPNPDWDYPPEYRTRWIQHYLNYARSRGLKVYYSLGLGLVPKEFARKNPNLPFMKGDVAYSGVDLLEQDSKEAEELGLKLIREYEKLYGTDNLYMSTPFCERLAAASPEEGLQLKITAAAELCKLLEKASPSYTWITDSWDFGATPQMWTPQAFERYFNAIPRDRVLIYDTGAEVRPFYEKTNFFGGVPWAFGVLHSFQGDDQLHGDIRLVAAAVKSAANDPKSTNLQGFWHSPESFGHNPLFFQLTTALSWDPNSVDVDEFLKEYTLTRYGRESFGNMYRANRRLVEAVYSGGNCEIYYQKFAVKYAPTLAPPFDDMVSYRELYPELCRQLPLLEEAVDYALREADRQKGNRLYENDMVDYTKTFLGLTANRHIIEAFDAFKAGKRERFEASAEKALECISGVQDILSTRPDYSLAAMIKQVMSVPGTNPYLPRMIRVHGAYDSYAVLENYEELVLYYRPMVEAYLDEIRRRMDAGINTFERKDIDPAFNRLYQRWVDEEVVCPDAIKFKGTTLEAVVSASRSRGRY